MTRRRPRIPPDVQRVLDDHRALGEAARRGLRVSERVTRSRVEEAARHAAALRRRAGDG